jgi:hypothetical protein
MAASPVARTGALVLLHGIGPREVVPRPQQVDGSDIGRGPAVDVSQASDEVWVTYTRNVINVVDDIFGSKKKIRENKNKRQGRLVEKKESAEM